MPSAPAHRLYRTSAFRLALVYMVLFAASVLVLLGVFYWSTLAVIDRQTTENIDAEIRGLAEQYRDEGLTRLVEVLNERSGGIGAKSNVYLLADSASRRIAGNLLEWPADTAPGSGWVDLELGTSDGGNLTAHRVRARTFALPGDYRLLVGRDMQEQARLRQIVLGALAWALPGMVILGLAGGFLMSRNMLRRVDGIAAAAHRIMRGDLSQRVPTNQSGDEFDRLAKALNEMLDQIEQLMTGMRAVTDSLGHDLRSPLTRLKGRIEMTLRGKPDVEAYRRTLDQAIADTDAILGTFNALMSVAMAEAGIGRTDMTDVDIAEIGRDAVELYDPLAEENAQELSFAAEGPAVMRGHRQLLAQAVANLLDNAVKYSPPGTAVRLSVSGSADWVFLRVCDNGPGVAVEDRDHVLGRFVRLDNSRSKPGSGLGLSLVAAVAKLHGAKLSLEDNAPGLRVTLAFRKSPHAA